MSQEPHPFRDGSSQQTALSGNTKLTSVKNCKFEGTDFNNVFKGCSSLSVFSGNKFGTGIKSFNGMFDSCNLTNVTFKTANFNQATSVATMFQMCPNLESVKNDFSNATSTVSMFYRCYKLKTVDSSFESAINCEGMYKECSVLTNIPTSYPSCENGGEMFGDANGSALENVDFYMPNLKRTYMMFLRCQSLKTYTGDLSNVVCNDNSDWATCQSMFIGCDHIEEVNITTNSNNAALFTKAALAITSPNAVLKVNGTVVNE